jgi:hypothetical protein
VNITLKPQLVVSEPLLFSILPIKPATTTQIEKPFLKIKKNTTTTTKPFSFDNFGKYGRKKNLLKINNNKKKKEL